ncbi:MAG: hypothetical protein ACJ77N_15545 [Chloroflexota bacterium]
MRRLLATAALALVAAACSAPAAVSTAAASASSTSASASLSSASASTSIAPSTSAGASTSGSATIPASPVVGVVTNVDSTGLTSVSGFTLRTNDGQTLTFRIGTLENAADFPPGHLSEHQATSEPVKVSFRQVGNDLVVYRLEDAAGSS